MAKQIPMSVKKKDKSSRGKNRYLINSIAKALSILDLFDFGKEQLSASHIATELNLNRSSIYPILCTLREFGYLQKNKLSKKYRLGLKFIEKGEVVIGHLEVAKIAESYLYELAHSLGESVYLAVLEKMDVIHIVCKHPIPQTFPHLMVNSPIGTRAPAHCTALGKVLLASLAQKKLDELLGQTELNLLTENTITDKKLLKEHLARVYKQGFAIDNEEFVAGGVCVAAPMMNHTGEVIAAISVFAPAARVSPERLKELTKKIKCTAARISHDLGAADN